MMNNQTGDATILFADICKSSRVYEVLGDHAARNVIGDILNQLSGATEQFHGKIVKTLGDAVMSRFSSVEAAVEAAKIMQKLIKKNFSDIPNLSPINIHIGLHKGPVVKDKGDIFGDAVNITARLADFAKPRQIVTTKSTLDDIPETSSPLIRYISRISVKNISDDIDVYEIVWEKKEMTVMMSHKNLSGVFHSQLDLTVGGQTFVIDNDQPVITIGRKNYNDIVIDFFWISRTHVSIEYRKGIFMIVDKSSNGTFIYPDGSEPKYIKMTEHPLADNGYILLGMDKDGEPYNEIIKYSVK